MMQYYLILIIFALITHLGINLCGIYYSCTKPTPLEAYELEKVFDGLWTQVRTIYCLKVKAKNLLINL